MKHLVLLSAVVSTLLLIGCANQNPNTANSDAVARQNVSDAGTRNVSNHQTSGMTNSVPRR